MREKATPPCVQPRYVDMSGAFSCKSFEKKTSDGKSDKFISKVTSKGRREETTTLEF